MWKGLQCCLVNDGKKTFTVIVSVPHQTSSTSDIVNYCTIPYETSYMCVHTPALVARSLVWQVNTLSVSIEYLYIHHQLDDTMNMMTVHVS